MSTEIAVIEAGQDGLAAMPTMVRPLVDGRAALDAWNAFQDIKAALITPDDVQHIQGRDFLKKSAFLKIAAAFGLNTEIIRAEKDELTTPQGSPYFQWRLTVRATAPNGRFMEAVGACASNERRFSHADADVFAQAQTRATSRAISNLIGGGAVSAEEMKAEAPYRITRERAHELMEQFVASCDKQSVYFDYPTLCELLLTTADDLRRAFKYFKEKGEGAGPEEAPADD